MRMMAPEKTTRAIIEWLNTEINEVLTDPDVRERLNLALLACQAKDLLEIIFNASPLDDLPC